MPEKVHSVTALTEALVADDASRVQVHFSTPDGELAVAMTANSLGQVVMRLTEIESALRDQIGAATGHVGTYASSVLAVAAQEVIGGGKVAVSFQTTAGRTQSFALSLDQAQQLRADLRKAEAKSREQASTSRN
jgi:hypothetical protein